MYAGYVYIHRKVCYHAYMNWDDIKIFDAAASNGSLSAGSKALGLSQPQTSRRLRELETAFGVRLFDRTPQGLRPTDAGMKLIPLAADMRDAADQIARIAPELSSAAISTVRIAVDEIREYFLMSHLGDLRKALDGVTLEIFSDHSHPDHETRKTDVQIRSCLPDSETLIAKRVGETSYGLFIHETLFEPAWHEQNGANLKNIPYIDLSPDFLWYPIQKRWLEEHMNGEPDLRVNTMTAMLHGVLAGQGAALLPRFMAKDKRELIEVKTKQSPPTTIEYIIVHRDLLRAKAVRKVVDEITKLYKRERRKLAETL